MLHADRLTLRANLATLHADRPTLHASHCFCFYLFVDRCLVLWFCPVAISSNRRSLMTTNIPPQLDLTNPNSPILDIDGLAALLAISPASIPARRSRTPERVPPPYLSRPLRWRRETVLRWITEQEERARREAELGAPRNGALKRAYSPKGPVHQVCALTRGPAIAGRSAFQFSAHRRRAHRFERLVSLPTAFRGTQNQPAKQYGISLRQSAGSAP